MGNLAHILGQRNPVLCVLRQTDTVSEAVRILAARELGALLVTTERGRLAGVFTERDLLRRVMALGRDPEDTPLGDVMTRNPVTASPNDDRETAISKMRRVGCRHLPVVVDGNVIDMLSMRDLLFVEIEERRSEVVQLRAYINGSY